MPAVAVFAATAVSAPAGGWAAAGLMFLGGAVVLMAAVAAAVHRDRAPAAVTAILSDPADLEAAPEAGERTVVPFDAADAGPVVGSFDVVVDGASGPVVVTVDVSDTHLVAFRFR